MKILAVIVNVPYEFGELHGVFDEEHRKQAKDLKDELHNPYSEVSGEHAELIELELNKRRWPPE